MSYGVSIAKTDNPYEYTIWMIVVSLHYGDYVQSS